MSKLKQSGKSKTLARQSKGITLVALIITIIVLLILAMVSIRLVMNGGIIDRAERGTAEYSVAEEKEQIQLGYKEYQMAQFEGGNAQLTVEGATVTAKTGGGWTVAFGSGRTYEVATDGTITGGETANSVPQQSSEWEDNGNGSYTKGSVTVQVGDTVKYETKLTANAVDGNKKASLISDLGIYSGNTNTSYNTDTSVVRDNLTWEVLDVKDGKIRLISATPTSSKIKLEKADGYNNAVYLLDNACDTLYSIDGTGKAQNLKIEDIEEKIDKTKFDYTNFLNTNVTSNIRYNSTIVHTSNLKYPKIYPMEVGCKAVSNISNTGNTLGLSEQTSTVTGSLTATSRLEVTQTYWYRKMVSTDFIDSKYYNLFINNGSNYPDYWLSSRCVDSGTDDRGGATYALFEVRRVRSGFVDSRELLYSYGTTNGGNYAFRPVVSLESNVRLTGDSTNGWTIQ